MDDDDDELKNDRHGLSVDVSRVWLSMRSRWQAVPFGGVAGLGLGVCLALLMHDVYEAESVLVWEPVEVNGRLERDLATHAGILQLPTVLEKAASDLGPATNAAGIASRVEVGFDAHSNLVTVWATGDTPDDAAGLVDAVVRAFLDEQRSLMRTRAEEALGALEMEIKIAGRAKEAAERSLDTFRQRHHVVDPISELALAREAVADLRDSAVRRSGSGSATTRRRVAQLRTELAEARARLAPTHPNVLALQAQLRGLAWQAADADEEQGQGGELLKSAEARLAALAAIEGQAQERMTELDRARTYLDERRTEALRVRQAALTPAVDFRVLSSGRESVHLEQSRRRLAIAGSGLFGVLCAIAALIVRSLRGGRVYTAREAAYWSGCPVIASTTWPSRPDSFVAFVGDVADGALGASGTTLLLGLTDRECPLADHLARALRPGLQEAAALTHSNKAPLATYAWCGSHRDPSLRRAVRLADRVVVLVRSGGESMLSLARLRGRLGREDHVAVALVELPEELLDLPDRVGEVEAFWSRGADTQNATWPRQPTVKMISA